MTKPTSLLVILAILHALPCSAAFGQGSNVQAKTLADKAQEQALAKDYPQAIGLMKKAIVLAPSNDAYLAMTSEFELQAGKYADGLEHAEQAIKLNDKDGGYLVLAAANAYGNQDLDRAKTYCTKVLEKGQSVVGARPIQEASYLLDLVSKKEFTLYWNLDPKKAVVAPVGGVYTVALPKTGLPYQTVTYEIRDVKSSKLLKGDFNDTLSIVPQGQNPFSLTIKVINQPYSFKKELAKANSKPVPADTKSFLGPFLMVDPKSPTLKKTVAPLKEKESLATVQSILAWMKKSIDYKLERSDSLTQHDFKNVDEIVKRRYAECRGYAMLFTALCRSADIPARPVWGLLRVDPGAGKKPNNIVSHNWAEVYITGAGWLPVDPQRPETLGFLPNNYLRFTTDARQNEASLETVPMLNLMSMIGGKLKFEEGR
jgi:transglutaminase-like putative cysteine protease